MLPLATSEEAHPIKNVVSVLALKLGAKLINFHKLRAKQLYLQNFIP